MAQASSAARGGLPAKAQSAAAAPGPTAQVDLDPLADFYASLEEPAAVQPSATTGGDKQSTAATDADVNPFADASTHEGLSDHSSDEESGSAAKSAATSSSDPAAAATTGPATSSDAEVSAAAAAAARAALSAELAAANLGSGAAQIDRLLQRNHEWINLNPFEVLCLPLGVTSEDVKARFRKLSALVHPDKHPGDSDRANAAFQEVRVGGSQRRCHCYSYRALPYPTRR
jgi:hypothetical protein